jgi:uncharacterized coiled-coil protein SlyX
MSNSNQSGDLGSVTTENKELETRLQEMEIKMAFLEKELEEYKEASRGFYRKLSQTEEEISKLWKELPERDQPTPEPTWDAESREVRP